MTMRSVRKDVKCRETRGDARLTRRVMSNEVDAQKGAKREYVRAERAAAKMLMFAARYALQMRQTPR